MRRGSSRSLLAFVAALALAALPRAGTAAQAKPSAGIVRASVVPLFDVSQRFKPKRTFKLRFRAREMTGAPVAAADISFSLRRGAQGAAVDLQARQVKQGVFEVRFTPDGPGRYSLVPAVLGVPASSIPPVRLGVVGTADGIVEEPAEADLQAHRKARKLARRR